MQVLMEYITWHGQYRIQQVEHLLKPIYTRPSPVRYMMNIHSVHGDTEGSLKARSFHVGAQPSRSAD